MRRTAKKFQVFGLGIFLSKPTGLVYHHDAVVYIIAEGVYHHAKRVLKTVGLMIYNGYHC